MTLRALAKAGETRQLEKNEIVLVDLTDFDVQIGVTENRGIQIFEVTDIVTRWMNSVFGQCLQDGGWGEEDYAQFDTIILLQRAGRRLQDSSAEEDEFDGPRIGELYMAEFKGAALFTKKDNQTEVPESAVYDCQRITNLEDDVLLESFQSSTSPGLGTAVVDVQAYVTPNTGRSNNTSQDSSLELVIIIAIVIACVAFLFLIFAIFWAWRYDKRNRQAFLAEPHRKTPNETFDANNSPEVTKERPKTEETGALVAPSYPSVIGGDSQAEGGVYPESVISEDIHSSLSQYYAGGTSGNYNYTNGRLQDAASVSSMESYGYSLDGYTPSLTNPHPTVTTSLPTEPANTDAWKATKDMRKSDEAGEFGISSDYVYKVQAATAPTDTDDDDHPMDEKEMPPPPGAEDMSMVDSMADESAINTAIASAIYTTVEPR